MDDDFTHTRFEHASDEELVAHIRAAHERGDAAAIGDAFDHLHFRHRRRVNALLRKVPDDRVEELEQDVFMAAFEGIVGGREFGSFKAWLTQVARNHVAELWRGKEGRQIKQDREAAARDRRDPDAPAPPEPGVDGGYGEWEAWEAIDQLLRARPDLHREIIELFVLDGRDAAETAQRTGASADNVYQVARRFRVDLRRLLEGGHTDNDDPGRGREDRI